MENTRCVDSPWGLRDVRAANDFKQIGFGIAGTPCVGLAVP